MNGFIYTDVFGNGFDRAQDLLVQPDGKIAAAGTWDDFGSDASQFAVVRYNASVAIQADGRIVVAGGNQPGGTANGEIDRYLTNGALDGSFDGDDLMMLTPAVARGRPR